MERLTERNEYGIGVCAANCDKDYPVSCMGCGKAYDAFDRLSAYEDTELEPSGIEGLKVDYWSASKEIKRLQAENKAYRTMIAEYKQAESDRLLLRLPCKVGDTVYCTNKGRVVLDEVVSFKYDGVLSFRLENTGTVNWSIERFGKTVFLTQSEAEQALKQLEGTK